jgi:hypothetical protein
MWFTLTCRSDGEEHLRALLLQAMATADLHFHELNSRKSITPTASKSARRSHQTRTKMRLSKRLPVD